MYHLWKDICFLYAIHILMQKIDKCFSFGSKKHFMRGQTFIMLVILLQIWRWIAEFADYSSWNCHCTNMLYFDCISDIFKGIHFIIVNRPIYWLLLTMLFYVFGAMPFKKLDGKFIKYKTTSWCSPIQAYTMPFTIWQWPSKEAFAAWEVCVPHEQEWLKQR